MRWLGPEFLVLNSPIPSKAGDVFAFGMVIVEVFTGQVPFHDRMQGEAAALISQGIRPSKPSNAREIGLTDPIWRLTCKCWNQDPSKRPNVEKVVRKLENAAVDGDSAESKRSKFHILRCSDSRHSYTDTIEKLLFCGLF